MKGAYAAIPVLLVLQSWSRVEMVDPFLRLVITASIAGLGFVGLLVVFGLDDEDRELLRLFRVTPGSPGRYEWRH